MTRYTQEDLEKDWEFKIVRSTFGAFRKTQVRQALVEEEALAGLELLEKLDEHCVRYKRPIQARSRDALLPDYVDPYRTQVGWGGKRSSLVIVALLAGLLLAAGFAVFLVMTI